MSAVISTVSNLLKDVYLPPVVEQLSNEVELLNRIKKKSDAELVGNQVVLPLHTNRSGGIIRGAAYGWEPGLPARGL